MKKVFLILFLFCCARSMGQGARVAYVNIDSAEAHYSLLQQKRAEFAERKSKMEAQLQQTYQELEKDVDDMQAKAKANTLTATEYDVAQQRLTDRQKDLETQKQTMTDQLMKEQDAFNADIKRRLTNYLEEYNKTHHYDCILSYSYESSTVLYIDKKLDITNDVIKGLNAAADREMRNK